jgi:hypothetical protein
MGYPLQPVRDYSDSITALATSQSAPATSIVGLRLPGLSQGVGIQIEGVFVATLEFEASIDGQNFHPLSVTPIGAPPAVTTASAPGIFLAPAGGYRSIQVRATAFTSGAAKITIHVS